LRRGGKLGQDRDDSASTSTPGGIRNAKSFGGSRSSSCGRSVRRARPVSSHAADKTAYNLPWEKFNIQGGAFFAGLNNKVTLGTEGAGVAIDLEQALGLDTQNTVFRLGTLYRIDEKRRHRVDLDYLYFNRNATKTLGKPITVDNVTIAAGSRVDTTFNYQILRAAYSYSFFQDDRMDLAGSFGLFVMPIKFALSAEGLRSGQGEFKFTAPLPRSGCAATSPSPPGGFSGPTSISSTWSIRVSKGRSWTRESPSNTTPGSISASALDSTTSGWD